MITWKQSTETLRLDFNFAACTVSLLTYCSKKKLYIYMSIFHYFFVIQNFNFHFLHSCAKNNRPSTYAFHESPADTVLCQQENKAARSEVLFITTGQFSIQTAVILRSQCVERLCLIISYWFSLLPL